MGKVTHFQVGLHIERELFALEGLDEDFHWDILALVIESVFLSTTGRRLVSARTNERCTILAS